MFSAPFTMSRHERPGRARLVTLGWPQFVALVASLLGLAAVISIMLMPAS
jgi:hypothetical protein